MSKAHERAIQNALDTGDDIKTLFDKLGSADHPRGVIMSLYRSFLREVEPHLDNPLVVREMLRTFKTRLTVAFTQVFEQAALVGANRAERDIARNDIVENSALLPDPILSQLTQPARDAIASAIDAQINAVYAQLAMGRDPVSIIGDSGRVGLLSPASLLKIGKRIVAEMVSSARDQRLEAAFVGGFGNIGGLILPDANAVAKAEVYKRQAIAAIDERTTDCCLRVNGQVVGVDELFRLAGTPRYADKMADPPFHDYCRTSVALVHEDDIDDRMTSDMRKAAIAEIKAREDGSRVEINPADSKSGRQ
jgi:hypothetical protein